jgi:hypothetical protein
LKTILLAIATFAVGAVAFSLFQQRGDSAPATQSASATAPAANGEKLSASSVLKIDPKVRSALPAAAIAPKVTASPDMLQYRDKKDWPQLYQRLKSGPQTPESQFLQAELLERCAERPPPTDGKPAPDTREVRREKFVQTLAGTEAQKKARLAAYDALNADACGELRAIDYVKDDVARLRKAAADAGDVRARAHQINDEIIKAYEEANKPRPDGSRTDTVGYPVSDAQWAAMREVLASGDPAAISELRGVLASTLADASIRIGPDKEPIDNRAFWNAWGLAACDLGQNCGADSPQLLSVCAHQNQCGSASVQDHTYYYDSSPYTAQLVERYRLMIGDMIRTGNFDSLNLARGPQGRQSTFMFRNR